MPSFFPTSSILPTVDQEDNDSNHEAEKRWLTWSNALLKTCRSSISGSIDEIQHFDFKRYTYPLSKREYDTLYNISRPPKATRIYRRCTVSPSATVPSNKAQQTLKSSFGLTPQIKNYKELKLCDSVGKRASQPLQSINETNCELGAHQEYRHSLDITLSSGLLRASTVSDAAHSRQEAPSAVLTPPEPIQLPTLIPMLRHHTISSMSSLSIYSAVEQNDLQSRHISAIWVDSFGKFHKNHFQVGQNETKTQEPESVRMPFGLCILPCSTDSLLFLFGFIFFPLWWIGAWRYFKYPSREINPSETKSILPLSSRGIRQLNCWMSVSSILITAILVGLLVWLSKDEDWL
ncbi:hypothetical protein J3Q64DRAFT_1778108 [Phycomyces blakesleeanus]|uniref:Uncharacterized protein n=2 Tax=Phycomyces blakesleeanus TaxID=4837 RepID=A0A162TUS5_PHYB8|nr:hypothetical protein PHYBLDRAFT_149157 [Phycomyces blakesleeanus NRRL 1555(-)]OAD69993.1 hypothetical protein PHYBLDRAFT_149157 [Phycomyces blakesleeanus NRRL 1555(-)]|eukprot:XP_018288033.1 hypothetical protein PHYBLDRAFT_149157 [Phycomyces blakesleeanus NRRL 1555(-)]